MAKKASNVLAKLTNAKTRTFLILFAAIIVIGIIIAISQGEDESADALSKQGSQAVGVPSSIKSTPGGASSQKYRETTIKHNEQRAQRALEERTSAIPTIMGAVGDGSGDGANADQLALEEAMRRQREGAGGGLQLGGAQGGGFGADGQGAFGGLGAGGFGADGLGPDGQRRKTPQELQREAMEARLREQRERLERERLEQLRQQELERQRLEALKREKEYQAEVQKIASAMKSYSSGLYNEWSKPNTQTYVAGTLANQEAKSKSSSKGRSQGQGMSAKPERYTPRRVGRDNDLNKARRKVYIKAGTILFAVMQTALNSDEPGPVMAQIVSGKYAGGKLIGAFTHSGQQESVTISFTQMTLPKRTQSFGVSAVAIDPETARTALATDVNRHMLLRYGSLFASSFIQGYGEAVTNQGTTTVSPLTGAVTTTKEELDNREIFFAALGELGTQWSAAIKPYFNTPYTVTVDKGTSVGLLFLSDVEVTGNEG